MFMFFFVFSVLFAKAKRSESNWKQCDVFETFGRPILLDFIVCLEAIQCQVKHEIINSLESF